MKNKVLILFMFVISQGWLMAQTPQHVTQTDKEQINFWESNTAMIIGIVVIVLLIIARTWSKRIHKKRDEVVNNKNEDEN
ncbi:hypothetical protein CW751_03555 [Brumimicrobium salinarum]|uniref:CcmD family protein n=1 Tax=Brumimicrobium salinarum TaxID=2058658 RepID=A0A2I0R4U7_9FLAO|nr:hypothetical protein [Brumimicrobium salinarum]PKR81612.1 hypothetical protein CW751_03555 [Brumimicrobium salinarum]